MNICPKCGLPFERSFAIEELITCDYCGWSGASSDTLITGSSKFEDDELFRLRTLFIRIAKEISPQIMSCLIQEGFFEAKPADVPRMIPVLAATTRAMFEALVVALCDLPEKEEDDASRPLHS